MRLNVGSGMSPRTDGQINADLYPGPNVDVVFDATKAWPFRDNAIDVVTGTHVLEHLADPWAFFSEAWRVLKPSKTCNLQLRLPYGGSPEALADLTHIRPWMATSFCCFQPGYDEAVFNPQHKSWRFPFSVISLYLRINPALRWLLIPGIRRWGLSMIGFLWGGFTEIIIGMQALKKEADVLRWKMENEANSVRIAYCMYHHEYKGRCLREGETLRLLFFGPNAKYLQRLSDAYLS